MKVKKKILIVGGAGYLGGSVTDILSANSEYQFRVYDNLTYEDTYRKKVDFVYGDILDQDKLLPQLKWADVVVWLAALVGDGASSIDEMLTFQINQEMVKWLAQNFDGRIIFTSTCSVYGAQDKLLVEDAPVKPISLYAYTKVKAEKYLKDKDAIIFRLGTLFGISDSYSRLRLDLVVNLMTARAYRVGKISVFGGEQYRPLLHVRDAAQALVKAIEIPKQEDSQVMNISTENIKIVDLANKVKKYFPDLEIETTEISFQDARNYKVSCDRAKKIFNFNPQVSIDDGIKELKDLFSQQRIKNFDDLHFVNQSHLQNYLINT